MVALHSDLLATEAPLPCSAVSFILLEAAGSPSRLGSPSCRDSGLGRSLHTLRAGTQEADGFPLLPIHPGNGRGPAWEQEAGTGPGVGGRVSLKISERRKTPDQFHQAVEHIPHTLITFLGKHGGQ